MARERCQGRDRSHRWRPARRCHSSSIAVDRNSVEGLIRHFAKQAVELFWRRSQISEEIDEHGGHLRMDHARSFGDAEKR